MEKFLLIDDDHTVRELCESMLSRSFDDALIDHSSNGIEALEKTSLGDYSAIICDIDMPLMGGIEFYKKLKLDSPCLARRVLFVSGDFNEETLSFLDNEGCLYVPKPFVKKELLLVLNTVLRR